MASGTGVIALALLFLSAYPFLSASASFTTPSVSVDRTLKGDRLPVTDPAVNLPDWRNEFGAAPSAQPGAQIPFACDAAISTIFAPRAANIYRRCMA